MFYTAQIRSADNVVDAVSSTTSPLNNPPDGIFFIPIDSFREYVGWTYVDGEFVPPPQ